MKFNFEEFFIFLLDWLSFQIHIQTFLKNSFEFKPYVIDIKTTICKMNHINKVFGTLENPVFAPLMRELFSMQEGCECPLKVFFFSIFLLESILSVNLFLERWFLLHKWTCSRFQICSANTVDWRIQVELFLNLKLYVNVKNI